MNSNQQWDTAYTRFPFEETEPASGWLAHPTALYVNVRTKIQREIHAPNPPRVALLMRAMCGEK
jgi:hypothetical protein